MMVYVVAEMLGRGEHFQMNEILGAISAGDWYTDEIAALAAADQATQMVIEQISDRHYRQAIFTVYGVYKFELTGLVGTYDA